MDFYKILNVDDKGMSFNPYASKRDDEWQQGFISVDFLNDNFGQFTNATEMKDATSSDGLKLYFDWLVEQEIIPN